MSDTRPEPAGPARGTSTFTADSDYDLLEMMTWRQTDLQASTDAWAELYRRHAGYLYAVCRKLTRYLGGDAAAEDLVAETLKHVYESAARTFRPGPSKDPETIRKHVRAWLGVIAQNLFRDALRGHGGHESHLDQEQWQKIPDRHQPIPSPGTKRVRQAMQDVLTERERHVLLVTFQWYDPDRRSQRLPNDVAADLAAQWGTNSENIRQIRNRAMRKLAEALAAEKEGAVNRGENTLQDRP